MSPGKPTRTGALPFMPWLMRFPWPTLAVLGALLLTFVGERLLAPESSRVAVTGLGVVVMLAAVVGRALRILRQEDERRTVETTLLAFTLLAAAAIGVALFFATDPREADFPKLFTALRALLPILVVCSVLPLLFGEAAYASTSQAERIERLRVFDGVRSGLGLAFVLIFAFAAYYVAAERDSKIDLSYARTAKPGEATRKIVRALDEPVTVMAWYPPANDVGESVMEYLSGLEGESPNFKVERYDVAVDPEKAKSSGVSGNGSVLITRGGRKESMLIGLEIERARSDLRNLDGDFQKKLLAVARPKKTVYLVAGHGERSQEGSDKRGLVRGFVSEIEGMNHTVKTLTAAEGLGSEIPADAAAVLVVGPAEALLAEEEAALHRYFDRGGRLLIALDPTPKADFNSLLKPLGLKYLPTVLANDRAYFTLTRQLSDRTNIATISYSSHPSITSLSQLGRRAPLGLKDAGALELLPDKPKDVAVDFSIHAEAATWNDVNGNFLFDSGPEVRKGWELSAAIKKGAGDSEARAVVVADSDVFSDGLFELDGNYYFARDKMRWVLSEESYAGEVSREQDVAIQHSRKQDVFWFYSSVFAAPGVVLLAGWFASRKRRRSGGVRSVAKKGGAA